MSKKRSKKHKQIVCISTHYWNDPWFRKQHFMSRLYKEGYKIAYIEPSFSMARKPNASKKEYATNRFFAAVVEEIDKGLFIIKPPRYLPFWTMPSISKINSLYLSYHIQSALKRAEFNDYILWIYKPQFVNGLSGFSYKKLVFDITDDLAAYNYNDKSKSIYVKTCMEHLAKKSDLVLVTAHTLFEKFKDIASDIYLVPNGYDSNLFVREKEFLVPSDIKDIHKPIIGFVGTIFSFLDFELLKYVVQHNQDKSFVFIGNCEFNAKKEWSFIVKNYKNVFWLGKKQKTEIPQYINHFDACINPFKVDDVSRSVSPLKVFEYLAMGKPVISVDMESLKKEKIALFIYFASSYQDFNKKLNTALKERQLFEEKLNYQTIKEYSWDNLSKKVNNLVENLWTKE